MCVFCKIIDGTIPSYKVYEDDYVLAILDISQATYGHTLVLPKNHVENILEADSETMNKVFEVVRILSKVGAFCELAPGKDGLIHISKMSDKRIEKVEDVLQIGDKVKVMETRPLSKDKRWRLVEIVEKAK